MMLATMIMAALMATSAEADDATPSAEDRMAETFRRTMAHWRYDYDALKPGKAGVACIPWEQIDSAYLDEGIFEALGFSYSTAGDDVAVRIATDGCEQMKAAVRVTDCACEVVLIDDRIEVVVPVATADALR